MEHIPDGRLQGAISRPETDFIEVMMFGEDYKNLLKRLTWLESMRLALIDNAIQEKKMAIEYGICFSKKAFADGTHCDCFWECEGPCHFCGHPVADPGTTDCDCNYHSPELYDESGQLKNPRDGTTLKSFLQEDGTYDKIVEELDRKPPGDK